ncbi:MAG: hypothetical protein JOZ52_08775 [Acidobacteria bacterium]|nr:hypothetical protein [Acidobacteriota bacterium]
MANLDKSKRRLRPCYQPQAQTASSSNPSRGGAHLTRRQSTSDPPVSLPA